MNPDLTIHEAELIDARLQLRRDAKRLVWKIILKPQGEAQ